LFSLNHGLLRKTDHPEETMQSIWLIFSAGRSLVKMPLMLCRM
jgi:hypothetical protein